MSKLQRLLWISMLALCVTILSGLLLIGLENVAVEAQDEIVLGDSNSTIRLPEIYAQTQNSVATSIGLIGDESIDTYITALNTNERVFVSPAAFHQASNSGTSSSPADGFRFWNEGGYIYNTSFAQMVLIAALNLPDGATLNRFSMVVYDNDTTDDVIATIYRKSLTTNLANTPGEGLIAMTFPISDSTSVFEVSNTAFSGPTTVSDQYAYYIVFELAPNAQLNQRVFGFSVDYTLPTSAGSNVEVVPMAAFRQHSQNADDLRFDFENGFVRNTSGTDQACVMAPLFPPEGATLTELRASIFDDQSDTRNLSVDLRRVEMSSGTGAILATVSSNDVMGAPPDNNELSSTGFTSVVNSNYNYFITACFVAGTDLGIRLFGARVLYNP